MSAAENNTPQGEEILDTKMQEIERDIRNERMQNIIKQEEAVAVLEEKVNSKRERLKELDQFIGAKKDEYGVSVSEGISGFFRQRKLNKDMEYRAYLQETKELQSELLNLENNLGYAKEKLGEKEEAKETTKIEEAFFEEGEDEAAMAKKAEALEIGVEEPLEKYNFSQEELENSRSAYSKLIEEMNRKEAVEITHRLSQEDIGQYFKITDQISNSENQLADLKEEAVELRKYKGEEGLEEVLKKMRDIETDLAVMAKEWKDLDRRVQEYENKGRIEKRSDQKQARVIVLDFRNRLAKNQITRNQMVGVGLKMAA